MSRALKLAVGSVIVGVVVLALKYVAYLLTGSIALFSDALESIVNVATALAALIAIRVAAQPADDRHPYGHHKAEYLSAVLEGVLIIGAALVIFETAYFGFINPKPLDSPLEGLLVNAAASVINGAWSWVLIRDGKRYRSPALVADGWHLFSDVLSSVGVLCGVLLAVLTGWAFLDPALAALVAVNILWSGWRVLKESAGGLMDEAVSREMLDRIRRVISEEAFGALEAHDVRTRHAGRVTFIQFDLVVPGTMTVAEAHDICDRLETALVRDDEHAVVTIHVEPESQALQSGVPVL